MNKIYVDSDILLDLLAKRNPFFEYAAEVFSLGDLGEIEIFTSGLVLANVFYILRKSVGTEKAKEYIRKIRIIVRVLNLNEKIVDLTLNSIFSDFEDGLQYYTATENRIETLLTRNVKDYKETSILIQTPEQFIKARKNLP